MATSASLFTSLSGLPLTYLTDLHLQKHPLRRPTGRGSSMGQTSSPGDGDGSPRWLLRPHLHPSAPQGASVDGTWRQQSGWGGCKSIPSGDTGPVFC